MKLILFALVAFAAVSHADDSVGFHTQALLEQVNAELDFALQSASSSTGIDFLTNPFALICPISNFNNFINSILASITAGGGAGLTADQIAQIQASFQASIAPMIPCISNFCDWLAGPCGTLMTAYNQPCAPTITASTINNICNNNCLNSVQTVALQLGQCIAANSPQGGAGAGSLGSLGSLPSTFDAQSVFCTKNPAAGPTGGYCLAALSDTSGMANPSNPADPTNCPYWRSLGCCVATFGPIYTTFSTGVCSTTSGSTNVVTPANFATILTACGITATQACPQFGQVVAIVTAVWYLAGIDFAAYNALTLPNQIKLWYALAQDIAAQTTINIDNISVGGFTSATVNVQSDTLHVLSGTGVAANFVVRGSDSTGTTAAFTSLSTFQASTGTGTFTNLQAAATAQSVSSGTVQMSKTQSSQQQATQSGSGTSDAVSPVPTVFVALLAAAAALALRL